MKHAQRFLPGLVGILLFMLMVPSAFTQPAFPQLTGRVVDVAGIIPASVRQTLEAKLKAHENATSDQVVIATVQYVDGPSIEDYANRLFRHWHRRWAMHCLP